MAEIDFFSEFESVSHHHPIEREFMLRASCGKDRLSRIGGLYTSTRLSAGLYLWLAIQENRPGVIGR